MYAPGDAVLVLRFGAWVPARYVAPEEDAHRVDVGGLSLVLEDPLLRRSPANHSAGASSLPPKKKKFVCHPPLHVTNILSQ